MSQIIEKFDVGTTLALEWPILSVTCSHTITREQRGGDPVCKDTVRKKILD